MKHNHEKKKKIVTRGYQKRGGYSEIQKSLMITNKTIKEKKK